ncbi:hypothetical protein POPTR_009G016950v4 [Populus trichocarpa]|uniref:Uncharacterized protein n=1 Tax=Populus trichocarpa TaxID=3694 RepID=A0A3N7FJY7_POPTR|nr:hypothetical protein POPTR_009G016950v4 [Populus trichocarpa]
MFGWACVSLLLATFGSLCGAPFQSLLLAVAAVWVASSQELFALLSLSFLLWSRRVLVLDIIGRAADY